jgi:hypothetical protein
MKLQVKSEPQNRRISNIECRRVGSLRSVFYKIDRSTQKLTTGGIHYSTFDVGRSMFDAYSPPKEDSLVSFSIRPDVFLPAAGLKPDT